MVFACGALRRRAAHLLVPLTMLVVCVAAGCAGEGSAILREEWQTISIAGSPTGYEHTIIRKRTDPAPAIVTSSFSHMRVERLGDALDIKTNAEYIESAGRGLEYVALTTEAAGAVVRSTGRIRGDRFVIETNVAGRTITTDLPLERDVLGPYAVIERTRAEALREGASVRYRMPLPSPYGGLRVTECTLRVDGRQKVMLGGEEVELWHGTLEQEVLPGAPVEVWLDDMGFVARSISPVLTGIEMRRATDAEALAAVAPGHSVDIMDRFFIQSNRPIDRPYETKEVLYRIAGPPDVIARLAIEDRRQTIESRAPGEIMLRVRAVGDAAEPSGLVVDPACSAPSLYVQSDDPEIIALSREAAGNAATPRERALNMRRWVYRYIRSKDFTVGFASAKEAAISRRGDCTEHSVLLAALLRADGIPSRVAAGLVYFQGRFGYHMWTEAFLNDWTALDASMNQEVVDATHIKLAESNLASGQETVGLIPMVNIVGSLRVSVEEVK